MDKDIEKYKLKEILDGIDERIYNDVYSGYYQSRYKIKMCMWEKGKEIDVFFRGVKNTTYYQIEKLTDRRRMNLKQWHNLYLKNSTREEYKLIAEKEAHKWTENVLNPKSLISKFTGEQENYTPREIIIDVKKVLGSINLDPASCFLAQETIQAENFFTEKEDGLNQNWYGNVFLNPPYQQPLMNQFVLQKEELIFILKI